MKERDLFIFERLLDFPSKRRTYVNSAFLNAMMYKQKQS